MLDLIVWQKYFMNYKQVKNTDLPSLMKILV